MIPVLSPIEALGGTALTAGKVAGSGWIRAAGSVGHAGFLEIFNAAHVRAAYLGYGDGANIIDFVLENNHRLAFNYPPRVDSRPFFLAVRGTSDESGLNAAHKVTFTEAIDAGGVFVNSRFTAVVAGLYIFHASVMFGGLAGPLIVNPQFRLNGVGTLPVHYFDSSGPYWKCVPMTRCLQYLNIGDHVEVWMDYSGSGGTYTLSGGYAHFEGYLLG